MKQQARLRAIKWTTGAALLALVGCVEAPAPDTLPTPIPVETLARAIIDAPVEEGYPAVGALVTRIGEGAPSGSFCSASLIAPRWVLTAAHCVAGFATAPPERQRQLHFFSGTTPGQPEGGRLFQASRVLVHPGYFGPGGDRHYDMALFELVEPVEDIEPIPLFRGDLTEHIGEDVFYVGFGASNADGSGGGTKRSATLKLYSVLPTVYITEQLQGGVCFGDSGGPGLLTVNDRLEVIGVNSTVVGEPSCLTHSSQARVDVYQTWIDAVMEVESPASCLDDPALCACPEACGPNGVCDSARCGQNSCDSMLGCLRFCGTAVCSLGCLQRATPEANYLYSDLIDCVAERCPQGDFACIEARCARQYTGCLEGLDAVTGPQSCVELHRCAEGCPDGEPGCVDGCFYEGTLYAQAVFENVERCIEERCQDDPDVEACAARRCRQAFLTCLPAESCRLGGGDCAEGMACVPERWGATYCRETAALAVGEPCEPGQISCVDGALCFDGGQGPVCRELCSTGTDCRTDLPRCEVIDAPELPFPLGVCAIPCPDADADGACDEDDCAPDDPAIHPGAAEVCGPFDAEGVDEDCDGQIDEGCPTCVDGQGPGCEEAPDEDTPPAPEGRSAVGGGGGCQTSPQAPTPAPWLPGLLGLLTLALWWPRRRTHLPSSPLASSPTAPSTTRGDQPRREPRAARAAALARRSLTGLLLASLLLLAACSDGNPRQDQDDPNEPDADTADTGTPDADEPDVEPDAEPDEPEEPPPPGIQEIQQGLVPPGTRLTLEDVLVASPVGAQGFFLSDGSGEPFGGLWVTHGQEDPASLGLSQGDRVTLTGVVEEQSWDEEPTDDPLRTRTQLALTSPDDLMVLGEGALPPPLVVSPLELALPELAELYEGVVITVEAPTVSGAAPDQGSLVLDELLQADGTFTAFDFAWLDIGARFETVTGPLQYEAGSYRILPRGPEDLPRAPISLNGCIPNGGYTICPRRRSWDSARRDCSAQGGRLVILEDNDENLAVGALARTWLDRPFWIGLSDLGEEGTFVWYDGTPLTYAGWSDGEPNDYGDGEDCAHSNWQADGTWNDTRCNGRESFVCEFPGDGARCTEDLDCGQRMATCQDGSCVPTP